MFLAPVPPSLLTAEDGGAGFLPPGRHGQPLSQWAGCPPLAQVSKQQKIFWKVKNILQDRFASLKAKPNNLFVVSLSLSGLLMISKIPIFLVNLYHGGPHTGVLGAQVQQSTQDLFSKYFQSESLK